MMRTVPARRTAWATLACALIGSVAFGHSASDAYLTLTAVPGAGPIVVHGQWDIALRDLDVALKLDDDGDGKIVWRELRGHQAAIEKYAYGFLHVTADEQACTLKPTRQMVDFHADGAYAALFFDIVCDKAPKGLRLDYRLFFQIDPSHRGILVMRSGEALATAVLSPENASIHLAL